MATPTSSEIARPRGPAPVLAGLAAAWLCALAGASHAGVSGTAVAWGSNAFGQLDGFCRGKPVLVGLALQL
jgi:hypothetical protein